MTYFKQNMIMNAVKLWIMFPSVLMIRQVGENQLTLFVKICLSCKLFYFKQLGIITSRS